MKFSQTALEPSEIVKALCAFFNKVGGETKYSKIGSDESLPTFLVPVKTGKIENVFLLVRVFRDVQDYGIMYGHILKSTDLSLGPDLPIGGGILSLAGIHRITHLESVYANGYKEELQPSDAEPPKNLIIKCERWPGINQSIHIYPDGTFASEEYAL